MLLSQPGGSDGAPSQHDPVGAGSSPPSEGGMEHPQEGPHPSIPPANGPYASARAVHPAFQPTPNAGSQQ